MTRKRYLSVAAYVRICTRAGRSALSRLSKSIALLANSEKQMRKNRGRGTFYMDVELTSQKNYLQ